MRHRSFLASRFASFRYAIAGWIYLVANERNAQIHLVATLVAVAAGVGFGISRDEWLWLALAIAVVWAAEAINTSIERLSDAITVEHNDLIGKAKDVAAASVLILSIFALIVGVTIFGPHMIDLFGQ